MSKTRSIISKAFLLITLLLLPILFMGPINVSIYNIVSLIFRISVVKSDFILTLFNYLIKVPQLLICVFLLVYVFLSNRKVVTKVFITLFCLSLVLTTSLHEIMTFSCYLVLGTFIHKILLLFIYILNIAINVMYFILFLLVLLSSNANKVIKIIFAILLSFVFMTFILLDIVPLVNYLISPYGIIVSGMQDGIYAFNSTYKFFIFTNNLWAFTSLLGGAVSTSLIILIDSLFIVNVVYLIIAMKQKKNKC